MSESKSSSGGIGFCGLLTIVFITLKLCKVIDWSWWWVLSPAWIPALIGVILLVAYLILKYMQAGEEIKQSKNRKSKWQERMEQMQEAQKKRV